MNDIDTNAKIIWDYSLMHHELKPMDAVVALGTSDTRVAEYAADLFLKGFGKYLIVAGDSGEKYSKKKHFDKPEAEVFADVAREKGVPADKIIIENKSTNTEENIRFVQKLLKEKGLDLHSFLLVQKPFAERRMYATFRNFWPHAECIVSSAPTTYEAYKERLEREGKDLIGSVVGDVERVKLYPLRGFQIPQEVPDEVWQAHNFLVAKGFTRRCIPPLHFVGIGGVGMSALAQYFADQGLKVTGSDREASPVTELLEQKGIAVLIGQKAENIPERCDAVVYTDATTPENPERVEGKRRGIREYSYFEMLGTVSKNKRTIAVAGTHGKTTTTGMVAKILADAGASPTAIIGSIVKDFGSNYLHGDSEIFVVEADEYKAHLLHLSPEILVVNNLEWDHTDFYPSLSAMQETFRQAVEKVPTHGAIVTNPSDQAIAPILQNAKMKVIDYTKEPTYTLRLPGDFNESNARAAAAAARLALPTLTEESIATSLKNFHGTWRRFELKGTTANGATVYDDYAHHPTAVAKTLKALREKLHEATPRKKIVVAFHPHLYSRTRDLLDEFATAFADADQVFIAPIYAAREVDDGSVSSTILAERISDSGTPATALSFEEIEQEFKKFGPDTTLVTMGAGDIYKVADALVHHD